MKKKSKKNSFADWWQVLGDNEISLGRHRNPSGNHVSLNGLFDVKNKRGFIIKGVKLKVEEKEYCNYYRTSDSYGPRKYDQLMMVFNGWSFPVNEEYKIRQSE